MEDEERQKKLEAGKAKLAEYRQRKAHADSQKKQKKKKKKKTAEDSEGDSQRRVEVEPDKSVEAEEVCRDGSQEGNKDPPTTEFTFARTLRGGETVKHDQTYTIEPESEVSTTAEDYSSEVNGCHDDMTEILMMSSKDFIWDEVESLQQVTKGGTMQDMEDALAAETQSVEDLSQEEIRAAFGTEGVQQLQDFEAALQQRDGIITQLTANLQQAREEKDEIMKEFLELTEQSQKLQIQFQQLQAGETLRNTSHSSTAADLLQTRQQLVQYQQQLEEMNMEARKHQGRSSEHLEHISQLQHKLNEMEMSDEKDLIIAEQERVISERDCSLTQLEDELETSEKRLRDLQQRMATKESELEKCLDELESTKSDLESCIGEVDSCKSELEKGRVELESCQSELSASRQKERMSSNEIMQLMGSVEDLQKRCHQGSLSESDTIQKMQEETERKLELVRAELDEMYGQQIVQMKQELNLQHTGKVEQMTELHSTELELLKAQLSQSSTVSTAEVDSLNAKIKALQETLEQSQAMHDKTIHELSQVSREKFNLQVNVEDLLQDLRTANEKVELVSHSLISQESQQGELQRFQETIDSLKSDLAAAQEAAQDAETKHESETTNYKIKLEMLEREKDAVLDRMAESQEAELERLRTQLLFSHEEELTQQREELQRESFMTTENLLNEAAIKHERALNELRISYEEELHLLRREKANFATERDELLHQILGLKEDLKLALHSSKADELVEQLQELQVEIEELRKGGEERVRMENEFQTLLKKTVVLETQTKDKEQCWANKWKEQELETKTLIESINTLREELDAKLMKIETLTTEKSKIQQQVNELREEIENQRTTFSFAEKNFEVNYQELKDEYVCLVQAKTQLEERTLKETLESEAKIASLQSQIRELEESSRDIKMEDITTDGKSLVEKYTTELMEKLNVTLSEKESLTARLSEVTEQLMFAESKVGQLDEELIKVRTEIAKVMAHKESLGTVQEKEQGLMREQTTGLDAQRKAKLQQEEQAKSTASGSNRRKRRQRSKQERKLGREDCSREERQREEEEEAVVEEERAQCAAEQEKQPQMESQGECRLQMEAQRISLSQIHAAQLELLQEETDTRTHSLELQLQNQKVHGDLDDTKISKYQNMFQAVSKECSEIILSFRKMFGEEFLESVDEGCKPHSEERPETSESPSIVLEARELYRGLQQVKGTIEREHQRLSQLQALLRADGNKVMELQVAYDELRSSSEKEISDLRLQVARCSPSSSKGSEEQAGAPSTSITEESQRLKVEAQEKQLQLEDSHRQELERLRAHYQQQATETQERYATELFMLQQRLQEVTDTETPHRTIHFDIAFLTFSLSTVPESSFERVDEHSEELKDLVEDVLSEGGVEVHWPAKSAGLTAQLQALRTALYHKYVQEVATLKEQHSSELRRLREELEQESQREECQEERGGREQDLSSAGSCRQSPGAAGQVGLEEKQHWGRAEEEVAKAIVQMSVDFALQTERTRINKLVCETSTSIQTQSYEEEMEQRENEERTPRASFSPGAWLEEVERERLEKELEERNAEIRKLKEELQKTETAPEQHCFVELIPGSDYLSLTIYCMIRLQLGGSCGCQVQVRSLSDELLQHTLGVSVLDFRRRVSEFVLCSQEVALLFLCLRCTCCHSSTKIVVFLSAPRDSYFAMTGLLSVFSLLPVQAFKKREDDQKEVEEEEDPGGPGMKEAYAQKSSSQDDGESSDKDTERNLLREANEKLSQVLADVLKTTAAAEETMGLHIQSLYDASSEGRQASPPTSQRATWQRVNTQSFRPFSAGHAAESCQGSETGGDDASSWSGETEADDSMEVSQQMMDSLLQGAGTQLQNEEYLMGIGSRLQTALEKMLMAITDTTDQLEHARMTQTELMRESFRHNQEMSELLQKQEELQDRVSEESRAREQLALELHRAEGLIDGYTGERAALEEQLRQKAELQMSLEQELQVTGSRLQELEQERLQMQEERELLSRQQDAMREHAGPRELHLLEETEKLMKEKVEVQRQAEKENTDLLKQVKLLEAELEEQVNKVIELEHAQRTESGDLEQQIQALEKQLEKNRRFLDEQAVDREHERDFFQEEIQKLEKQLKNPQKLQGGSEQRNREVDQLTSQLKEKADWCSELLLSSEQLRRELRERDEEIDKLESRIRELEQALLASADSLEKVEQKKQHASITETRHSTLEAQLQTEREALERKEKEICNLEEQLEQFREELENKSEEVQQLQMQMEIQSKEISSQEQYQETRDSMLQVNTRPDAKTYRSISVGLYQKLLPTEVMEEKDRQIALLNEQITKLQHMETASDNKEIDEKDELIKDLESQVECLRSEQERLKRNSEEELDQLNAVIDKLQQELANIEQKQAAEEDEDIKGEPGSGAWGPGKDEYDEMKQRMDLATKELNTLKTDHSKLLETYRCFKEREGADETEKLGSSEGQLEEALREKTAGLVVMQAQVKALEQSATSRVEELGLRIQELEDLVAERDIEISRCRLLVEQTQSHADGFQRRVSNLEEDLREKVAGALVSQATLEVFQQQQQQAQGSRENRDVQRHADPQGKPNVEPRVHDFGDFGIPKMDFSGLGQPTQVSTGKVVHLTQKLLELEVGLSGMQKDQELQKQLLSSSEEEVLEYEKRLAMLMDLLSQMKSSTHQRTSAAVNVKSVEGADRTELQQELQEVRDDVASSKEELNSYRQRNEKLLQELQVREVSISKLKEELQQLIKDVDSTKEELNSYRQQNEKLQDELHVRELSISQLREERKPQSSASSSATTQPKRKGAKQPIAKGSSAKDKPSLSKKNSAASSQSSNRSHSSRPNSSIEQQHLAVADSFTQTEPLQMSRLSPENESVAKEEMEEVIGEFQEKIVQMQELHAAEILDMEARHISESENLRRDTHALEDECKALKAVIDKLRSTGTLASRQDRPTPQFKDGYTSDSSSDYSQRTGYDLPSLQQEFRTTPEGARRETDDPMPDRIKLLLREVHQEGMQVLSLSELPLSGGEPGNQFNVQGWVKEREDLLATVDSLKGLITQMKTRRETQAPGGVDWRAELLEAVRQVFLRERSVLKSTLYSQLDLLDTSDAIIHLNQLERRLAEQDAHHRDAMGSLHTAERSSLIVEIHQLRGQLEQLHQGVQPAVSLTGECSIKEQWEGGGGGAGGVTEADRLLVEELKGELFQTKLELETTLKTQHKHLKELDTLRAEVSKKAAEVDALNDQLTDEKKRGRDLQWAMEKEKCRTGRTEENKREQLEDLHLSLEEQKSRVAQLTLTLDQERRDSSQLSQQSELERLSLHRHLQELQVQLETERAKAREMSTALGRERELRTGRFSDNGSSNGEQVEEDRRGLEEDGSLLERLQRELDDKHAQVVHLLSQVEAQKLEVVRKEEELTLAGQRSRRDEEALQEARAQLENWEARISETQEQLEREGERRKSLEEEKERLEERLTRVGEQRGPRDGSGAQQAESHAQAVSNRASTDLTKDWVFQQKSGDVQSAGSSPSPHHELSPTGLTGGPHHGSWRTVDKVVGKLHLISSKIRSMANKTTGRLTAEVDSEELSWVQSSVDEVITLLQQSPGLPSIPESVSLLAGGSSSSSSSLTERLLRQNAELTGFVSRLTEEKNDLRNHTLRLEEELRRYRQAGLGAADSFSSRKGASKMDSDSMLLSHEREAWTREKVRLEKALHLAQSQVARLRGEIRTDTLREITGPEADNAALKRMYGKYLRSESFRKALIYQKKYLLLLLGGFQECEEATLSLLSRMGSRPSLHSLESFNQRRRGLMRFRSAVRVSIALSRMRFLVKRWHKATGMSSTAFCSVNKNGTGQTSSTDVRDSPYLHPGSVEMYREKGSGGGVSSSRGRSGRESPRSAISSTPHRFHVAGDHGGLTCSHLQSYDPDRALTDYISRLEALQRRLGSVTSGASSYAQLHFGLRR
ncbi:putative A-kinase anchor protein 9 [Scophthalmus maximus]|uniref:Putative A-kinase anchor protein 9 n=1 Tax=Scophthalmus maximus TaxID=52904 RepID=A0A2U9CY45_SCOMX|nr:putative A-kinase anchor protein 9 [Scophthalmus maximus]